MTDDEPAALLGIGGTTGVSLAHGAAAQRTFRLISGNYVLFITMNN